MVMTKDVLFSLTKGAYAPQEEMLEVARKKGKDKKEKIKTLSAKVVPAKVNIPNNISVNKNPTDKQVIARNAWLGLKEK